MPKQIKTRKNAWYTWDNFKELFYNAAARTYGLHKRVWMTGPWHECDSEINDDWMKIKIVMHPQMDRRTGETWFRVSWSDCDDYCGGKNFATVKEALEVYNSIVDGMDFTDLKAKGLDY